MRSILYWLIDFGLARRSWRLWRQGMDGCPIMPTEPRSLGLLFSVIPIRLFLCSALPKAFASFLDFSNTSIPSAEAFSSLYSSPASVNYTSFDYRTFLTNQSPLSRRLRSRDKHPSSYPLYFQRARTLLEDCRYGLSLVFLV